MRTLQEAIDALQTQRDFDARQQRQYEEEQESVKRDREEVHAEVFGKWLERSENIVLKDDEVLIEARESDAAYLGAYGFRVNLIGTGWVTTSPENLRNDMLGNVKLTWIAHCFANHSEYASNHDTFVAAALECYRNRKPEETVADSETSDA